MCRENVGKEKSLKKKQSSSICAENPVETIQQFVEHSKGLKLSMNSSNDEFTVYQHIDGKYLTFRCKDVEEVLKRKDAKKEPFIQINFYGDKKIILTDKFIGFKPFSIPDLDMAKLPKVVTTPDLLNFIEIIEDSMYEMDVSSVEVLDIRRYFESVLLGAEKVGFDLICERVCIEQLFQSHPALVSQAV